MHSPQNPVAHCSVAADEAAAGAVEMEVAEDVMFSCMNYLTALEVFENSTKT